MDRIATCHCVWRIVKLAWLGECVSVLAGIVETVCRERIAQLADTARSAG